MGVLSAAFGLIGLFMAAGAHDIGIAFFGIALALWATLFCWWMIKTAYDEIERSAGSSSSENLR